MTRQTTTFGGLKSLAITGLTALLVACGGSSSDDDDPITASTEVLAQGTIQRFGSVYVNDIRYVRGANGEVLIDDNPGAGEDSLRIGMRVKLRGRYNEDGTGTYDSIEVDNELKGPIGTGSIVIPDPVNAPNVGTFVVMGTTVISNEGTLFDESGGGNTVNSLANLQDGAGLEDVVEVSGLFNDIGQLEAIRIEKKADDLATFLADGRKLEVKGTVGSVDSGNMRFTYASGLVVDYMNAEIDNDLPSNPDNWVDLFVEAKCDPQAPTWGGSCFNGAVLLATKVDNEAPELAGAFEAELEGLITGFNGLGDFKVSQIPVDATDAIVRCGTIVLGDGVKVKVRGDVVEVNNMRKINASSVECRLAKTVRLEGEVQSNSGGTVTLLDIPVITNDKTEKDDLASIGDLFPGDAVKIRGFVDGSGNVIAVRVELEASIDPDDFIVQAPKAQLTNVDRNNNRFTLLGVTVDTSGLVEGTGLQDSDFEGLNDENILRSTFYDALENGTAPGVKAKGTYNPATRVLTADEVELRSSDD